MKPSWKNKLIAHFEFNFNKKIKQKLEKFFVICHIIFIVGRDIIHFYVKETGR